MVTTNDFPSFCASFLFDYFVVVEMGDEAILFIQIVGTLQCKQDERRWRWKAGEESLKAREGAKGRSRGSGRRRQRREKWRPRQSVRVSGSSGVGNGGHQRGANYF